MSVDGSIAIRHHWDLNVLRDIELAKRRVDIIFLDPDGANRGKRLYWRTCIQPRGLSVCCAFFFQSNDADIDFIRFSGSYEQKLTNPTGFEYTKLPITKSYELEPGVWRVQLRSYDGKVVAETAFPLLPADDGGKKLENVKYVDALVGRFYRVEHVCRAAAPPPPSRSDSAATNADQCDKLLRLAPNELSNAATADYQIGKETGGGGSATRLPLCKRTYWSSLSPDPKSEIRGFDWKSGVILP